ncbi:hypothetical protein XU18_2943 [Perkinsela sp. CCAP 1560/4]|nr:hypothetical protein XU18_2943 [Perkinsela sp. CCAP 1560/4]|eukprot:KNH06187.1 hypothetical protein XU18_2943 [Perkinsela sp. CCAP 1560/4]
MQTFKRKRCITVHPTFPMTEGIGDLTRLPGSLCAASMDMMHFRLKLSIHVHLENSTNHTSACSTLRHPHKYVAKRSLCSLRVVGHHCRSPHEIPNGWSCP